MPSRYMQHGTRLQELPQEAAITWSASGGYVISQRKVANGDLKCGKHRGLQETRQSRMKKKCCLCSVLEEEKGLEC
jgi:hypothetical protein